MCVLIGVLKNGKDIMLCYSFVVCLQILLECLLSVTDLSIHRLKNKRMNKSNKAISTPY